MNWQQGVMRTDRNQKHKKSKIPYIALTCVLLLTGCAAAADAGDEGAEAPMVENETAQDETSQGEIPSDTREFFAMDTYMTVTAYGNDAAEAVAQAVSRVEELDDMLSTGQEDSEIAVLNRSSDSVLSEDAFYLMSRAVEISEMTDGAFDPAIYPLMEEWGFTTGDYQVPDESRIEELLHHIDPGCIRLYEDTRRVEITDEKAAVDFGGIAKGYTSAQIMEIFGELDLVSGMVNLGGNVQVYGCKTDGSLWRVAVQSPDSEDEYLGVLEIADKAVITSGGYERYFEQDGTVYHHILDPATGYPADNGLKSVTIVSADGVLADGLSTALFVMGTEQAKQFWELNGDDFDVILLTDDGKLYVSEGIADSFETDYDAEILRREG
jgi:thiamine biosynthesis lipoprotein